ncbi:MAG: hypothetical protein HYU63_03005 [Armatimonadetes bacterium]|nr:hypothetical protein [Armatimonadota bacterium]
MEAKKVIKENPEMLDKEVYFSKDKNGKIFLTFNKPNLKSKSLPLNLGALDNFLEEVKYNFPMYNDLKPAFKLNQETKNIEITLAKDWKNCEPVYPEQDFIVTQKGYIQED